MSKLHKIGIVGVYVIAALFIIAAPSCNEAASPIGSEFKNDTSNLYTLSSDTERLITKTYNLPLRTFIGNTNPLFTAGVLYIGKSQTTSAFTLMKFITVPDTLGDDKDYEILSAKLTMFPLNYALGDTTANRLRFNVFEVVQQWGPFTTLDTIRTLEGNGPIHAEAPLEARVIDDDIIYQDSIPPLEIELNASGLELMREWFRKGADEELRTDIFGLAFIPDEENSSVVRQFSTSGIGTENVGATQLEVVLQMNGAAEPDTIFLRSANDGVFVDAPQPDSSGITIQGGVAFRSQLLFDISAIPELSSALDAELVLTLDRDRSEVGTGDIGEVSVFLASEDSSVISTVLIESDFPLNSELAYKFENISLAIELWSRGEASRLVLAMQSEDEIRKLNRLTFHGIDDEDPAKRPFVRIVYKTRPK